MGIERESELESGYFNVKLTPDDPFYPHTTGGWILKHRYIAMKESGHILDPKEEVIFKDGNKTNFDPDNLEVRVKKKRAFSKKFSDFPNIKAYVIDYLKSLSTKELSELLKEAGYGQSIHRPRP